MTDAELTALAQELCALRDRWGDAAAQGALAQQANLTPAQRARVEALVFPGSAQPGDIAGRDGRKGIEGDVTLSDDATINGVAVGINLGTIIYQRNPSEDERRQLARHLERLAAKLRRLPLSGLAAKLDDGEGMALDRVYVLLATRSHVTLARGQPARLKHFFRDGKIPQRDPAAHEHLAEAHHPDHALPDTAVVAIEWDDGQRGDPDPAQTLTLMRHRLATEAVAQSTHMVLLGDPGSGKSTFLRHLAWALAQRGLDQLAQRTQLHGWADDARLLPVFLPLRRLAGQIAGAGMAPAAVTDALVAELSREYGARAADALLDHALASDSAMLLLDGLDEVPLAATATSASREDTLRTVRAFADLYPQTRIVTTCRTRAFDDARLNSLGWPVEHLAPFSFGQNRAFIAAWFATLQARGSLDQEQATRYTQTLIDALRTSERLQRMAETPLLLTMMALVVVERGGKLPRDRSLLYEEVLSQLLGEWDVQKGGQSLAEVLGASKLRADDLRPILDELSFAAHADARSADGCGRLSALDLQVRLTQYLAQVRVPGAWEAAGRCLSYFSERSGLLRPEDTGESYAFAHLTLQEHCAGRHLLLQPGAVSAVMARRSDDRWREPIALGLGVVQRYYPMLADRMTSIFTELLDKDEGGRPKAPIRWYRDLLLAAELGQERDWDLLRAILPVERLQRDLRAGLVALLADRDQPLPVAERVRAGDLLGELGDPRVPVTVKAWQAALAQRNERFGQPVGYWCFVRGGTYQIGGWEAGDPQATITLPAFWIARSPITVAQYEPFVAEGYGPDAERWWTKQGWQWKQSRQRTQPWRWGEPAYSGSNQAVIGLSWYEATAYCAWLTEQLQGLLPEGYVVRLPTEAEWEAAAAYDGEGQRRPSPWGTQEPTPELAIYDASKLGRPAPVGCCPAGAAACGALDMAGNVWEWTCSSYQGYPAQSRQVGEDVSSGENDVPIRGGSWWGGSSGVRCGARGRYRPDVDFLYGWGGRVLLAPSFIAESPIADSR
jgi:formylglycine-generating enzyme required for sulfatase activity